MLLKLKRCLNLLLTSQKVPLMILIKKILMKKIKYRIVLKNKTRKFLSLALRKLHFPKYRKFFFYKKYGSFFSWVQPRKLHFPKYKKKIFLEKYKKFFQSVFFFFFGGGRERGVGGGVELGAKKFHPKI